MASQIIELANQVASVIDRVLNSDDWPIDREPPDNVFTDLYREFASGPVAFDEVHKVLESIRDIRDNAIGWTRFEKTPDELSMMKLAWGKFKPLLLGYAAYPDSAVQSGGTGGSDHSPAEAVNPMAVVPVITRGLAGMTLEKKGRVITVDGRCFHGVDATAFRVIEFLMNAEPEPVIKHTLFNKALINKDTTDTDMNARLPPGFPVRIKGGRGGWQLVYDSSSRGAAETCGE